MRDLLNRSRLQHHLWNAVLKLRNGQYYDASAAEFIGNVEMCRLNKHDTPDLVYGRYDGTVLKRLISAFSFRPTVISTTPIVTQMYNTNPYSHNVRPTVRSIPMINLRINGIDASRNLRLRDSIEQSTLVIEGKSFVQKKIDLIYSRGVLMFFVDRRAHYIQVGRMEPFNMGNLPVSVAGFERINPRKVSFDPSITVRGDVYNLRSVVAAEISKSSAAVQGGPGSYNPNVVVGSSAAVVIPQDASRGILTPNVYHYDPLAVMQAVSRGGRLERGKPVTAISWAPTRSNRGQSLEELGQKRGIIFLYQLRNDTSSTTGRAIVF